MFEKKKINRASQIELVGDASEGLFVARCKDSWFHVDERHRRLYEKEFDRAGLFQGGYAVVNDGGELYHITPEGECAYETTFDFLGPFFEGRAVARNGRRHFHIETNGLAAYTPSFAGVSSFREGLAVAELDNGKFIFIRHNGEQVFATAFEEAQPFQSGRALVQIGDTINYIDRRGKPVT